MARRPSQHPTELELQILDVLWDRGRSPVRDVRAALAEAGRPLAHSSVVTMLNIMHGKRLVRRRKVGKAFEFTAGVPREKVGVGMTRDLLGKLFGGSPAAMMLGLMDAGELDDEEIAEIRRLIDDHGPGDRS